MSDLSRAIGVAVDAHYGQYDKNGEPYILHPLRVMLAQTDEVSRVVAVLHDTVEDSKTVGHGDILALFGESVHAAIFALTRQEDEKYEDFISRAKENPIARRVKIADIKDNLRPGAEHLKTRYHAALAALKEEA